jgi:hypothetical protein
LRGEVPDSYPLAEKAQDQQVETAADGFGRASATPTRLLTPDLRGYRAAAAPRLSEAYFLTR